ncbi:MAG: SRPBCC family protein [Thermoleophilia bacterium]
MSPNRHGSAVVTTPSDTEILVTRVFDAPAELIFAAYTTPELVKRWWGFEDHEWLVCESDPVVGGRWRFVTREAGGMEVAFNGEYLEVEPPYRLVATEVYEPFPDAGAVNTLTLEEKDGASTLTLLTRYQQKEHRDMVIASGMEVGLQVSFDRMEDLVVAQAAA